PTFGRSPMLGRLPCPGVMIPGFTFGLSGGRDPICPRSPGEMFGRFPGEMFGVDGRCVGRLTFGRCVGRLSDGPEGRETFGRLGADGRDGRDGREPADPRPRPCASPRIKNTQASEAANAMRIFFMMPLPTVTDSRNCR